MEDTTAYDVVNFTNVSDEEFTGIYGGKERKFAPNSITQLPRFLANHFANQLAVKVLMNNGKEWGNDSPDKRDKIQEILGIPVVKPIAEVPIVVAKEVPMVVPVETPKEFEDLKEEEAKNGAEVKCEQCDKVFGTDKALAIHIGRSHKSN